MVVPQWDLGLGLAALKFASFKPLVDGDMMLHMFCALYLRMKTKWNPCVLSVSNSFLSFFRNKSAVTRLKYHSFSGKNQIPD